MQRSYAAAFAPGRAWPCASKRDSPAHLGSAGRLSPPAASRRTLKIGCPGPPTCGEHRHDRQGIDMTDVSTSATAHGPEVARRDRVNDFTELAREVAESGLMRRRYGYYWTKLIAV